jgi:hypothetical protein
VTKEVDGIDKMRGLDISPLKALAEFRDLVTTSRRFQYVALCGTQVCVCYGNLCVRLALELNKIT